MNSDDTDDAKSARRLMRGLVELCSNCDSCRPLMDEACVFFPELYRLWDLEKESGVPIVEADLRRLADLCTRCGICPCPRIPADIMAAKSRYIEQEGLPLAVRMLADVPRLARISALFPRLTAAVQSHKAVGPLLNRIAGIHPERRLPLFPQENFFQWAERQGLSARQPGRRSAAYFAGCSAGYLFPEIGRALVRVMEKNRIPVWVPQQNCCGMPHLLEGDRTTTLQNNRSNMRHLLAALQTGDDLVCSCPSCGYLMKNLLKERAYYAEKYQQAIGAGKDELKLPSPVEGNRGRQWVLKKSVFKGILKDDGYFSEIDPLERINLAEHILDAGEFLAGLHTEGRFDTAFISLDERLVYFAPCHQREQKIGLPYLDLMRLIPGISIEEVGGDMYCCGMGGNFGFKAGYHDKSLAVGHPLMEKIRRLAPQAIITDCMSCRLQFNHVLTCPVFHPLEILARAYRCEP